MNFLDKDKLVALAVTAAISTTMAPAAMAQLSKGQAVTFNGQPMFEIKAGAAGFDAKKRAWLAQDNFDNALVLAADRSPNAVKVIKDNGAFTVQLDNHYIVSADAKSANTKGVKPEELANRWAEAIKRRLGDSAATKAYVAKLTRDHKLSGDMAIVERSVYAPAGTVLPIRLAEGVLLANVKSQKDIRAVLTRDVIFDSYALPRNSVLVGKLVKTDKSNYMLRFSSLTTPSGTEVKLNGLPARVAVRTSGPEAIEHKKIPANPKSEAREPATVGIGAKKTKILFLEPTQKALNKGTSMVVAFEQPTEVSVTMRTR